MNLILETERLRLRPYTLVDAPYVQKLADDEALAKTTLLPHPYTVEMAEEWIAGHAQFIGASEAFPFAVILKSSEKLVGTMTLRINKQHHKGELAYWVGKDYWNKGYATEAARKVIEFGFQNQGLNRIWAPIMQNNKASGKVLQKAGLTYEGTLKQDILHWGEYKDIDVFGIVRVTGD